MSKTKKSENPARTIEEVQEKLALLEFAINGLFSSMEDSELSDDCREKFHCSIIEHFHTIDCLLESV